ncbi:MAG: DUF4091 domain-containing protein [Limnochordia bacterium]|nr:DUF4091 domain-containing protein [Limnochordia bacterium]
MYNVSWRSLVVVMGLLAFLGGMVDVSCADNCVIWVPGKLDKIQREQAPPELILPPLIEMESAQNEWEGAQLIIHAVERLESVEVTVNPLVHREGIGPDIVLEVFRQHYVHITEPTSVFPTGWYPDALPPLQSSLSVEAGHNQGLWLSLKVPAKQPAGLYEGSVVLTLHSSNNVQVSEIPVQLTVWDFALPDETHTMSAFALWGDQIARYYGITPGSPRYWQMLERYYWFQTEYRLPPDDLPIPYVDPDQYVRSAERFVERPEVYSFRIPFRNDPAETKQLVDLLREKGWLSKGYFYLGGLIDEPSPEQYPSVLMYGQQLKQIAPDARHVVTIHPVEPLSGAVDTWAPLVHYYDHEMAQARQAIGEHMWWYTCVMPTSPYPTYHIDDDLMGARLLSWFQWNWDIEGVLYWSTTVFEKWTGSRYVRRDPWEDPLAFPGANGDGFLLYPGPDGPVASLRIEAIRDGLEDYEYLYLLEQRLGETAAELGMELDSVRLRQTISLLFDRVFENAPLVVERDSIVVAEARRLLADMILRACKEPLMLMQLEPLTEDESAPAYSKQLLTLWTSPGAKVNVNDEVLTSIRQHEEADCFELVVDRYQKHTVRIEHNEESRQFVLSQSHSQKGLGDQTITVLTSFEEEDDIYRLMAQHVALSLTNERTSNGDFALKAVFRPGFDFPNIRFPIAGPKGFSPNDWPLKKYLTFDVWNDDVNQAQIYVKFHQVGGAAYDNNMVILAPHEWKQVKIPLEFVRLDRAQLLSVEIWMWKQQSSVTLCFDNFRLE